MKLSITFIKKIMIFGIDMYSHLLSKERSNLLDDGLKVIFHVFVPEKLLIGTWDIDKQPIR